MSFYFSTVNITTFYGIKKYRDKKKVLKEKMKNL